ncbi:hypothetical protein BSKO_08246 [Bryopsis sp. KO-2023]|nr:hypothetical protein BSKO_08246 [Bryopsis sp. KO-2023]
MLIEPQVQAGIFASRVGNLLEADRHLNRLLKKKHNTTWICTWMSEAVEIIERDHPGYLEGCLLLMENLVVEVEDLTGAQQVLELFETLVNREKVILPAGNREALAILFRMKQVEFAVEIVETSFLDRMLLVVTQSIRHLKKLAEEAFLAALSRKRLKRNVPDDSGVTYINCLITSRASDGHNMILKRCSIYEYKRKRSNPKERILLIEQLTAFGATYAKIPHLGKVDSISYHKSLRSKSVEGYLHVKATSSSYGSSLCRG